MRALFRFLNASGLRYCVLGDTRDYPDSIRGDIDIAVPRTALAAMPRLLARFCRTERLQLVQILGREPAAMYVVLASSDVEDKPRFLAIDFCSDYRRHGSLVVAAEAFLDRSCHALDATGRRKGFAVPEPAIQFIYYLVKKIDKLRVDRRQGDYLSACWREHPDGCEAQLRRFWPDDVALIARIAAGNDWSPLQSSLPALRTELRRRLRAPFRYRPQQWICKIARIVRPNGLSVMVSDMDTGVGGAVVDAVLQHMAPAFRGTQRVKRPPLARVHSNIPSADNTRRKRSLFGDVVGGLVTAPSRKARSMLLIVDCRYDDLAAGRRRCTNGVSAMLMRAIGKLLPKPDLCIVLDATSRPAELPGTDVTVIDTSRGTTHAIHDLDCAILACLTHRMERRYPTLSAADNSVGGKTAAVP